MKNALYFGDNLNVMREMASGTYHLCYLDPPFNSGRNYNIFLANSKAQRKAFDDIWHWDDAARESRAAVHHYDGRHPELVDVMDNLSFCLKGFDFMLTRGGEFRVYAGVSRFHGPAVGGDLAVAEAERERLSALRSACESLSEKRYGRYLWRAEFQKRDCVVLCRRRHPAQGFPTKARRAPTLCPREKRSLQH